MSHKYVLYYNFYYVLERKSLLKHQTKNIIF